MNMQWMRERSGSFFIMLIFGIIIVVFALQFGPGSRGFTSVSSYAAKVNGETVTVGEWSFYYNQLFNSYQQFDPNFNNEKAEQYGLKDKALDQVVTRVLLSQAGHRLGLAVGPLEVARNIVDNPAFQEDGQFDKDLYRRMVNYYYKMSVARYEEKHEEDMIGNRISTLLSEGPVLSANAAYDEWSVENDKINLEFVKFPVKSAIAKMQPTDEAIAAYAEKEAEKVETYFTNHQSDYEKPEQIRARHILIKVPEDASKRKKREAKSAIKSIAEEAKNNPDGFAELAQKTSEGPTKTKGGDLGFFSRGRMVKEFEDVAFALEPGQVSDPVKSQFGWHVIKLEERQAAESKSLDDMKLEIARTLLSEQMAKDSVKAEAEALLAGLKEGKSFEELLPAEEDGEKTEGKPAPVVPTLKTTGPFARTTGNYVPMIGASFELYDAAWKLTPENPLAPQVFDVGGDSVVLKLKEQLKPKREDFDTVASDELGRRSEKLSRQMFDAWLASAKANADIEKVVGISTVQENDVNF